MGIADAGERRHGPGRGAVQPRPIVIEQLGGLPAVEEMEFLIRVVRDVLIHPDDLALERGFERFLGCHGVRHTGSSGAQSERTARWSYGIAELLTNASRVPSGDHDGTLIVPCPPYT